MTKRSEKLVYKIFRAQEWDAFVATARYDGSADDRRDGFIHLSFVRQVRGTLDRFFSDDNDIVIAEFDGDAFEPEKLKREASESGDTYPHLYGQLFRDQVQTFWRLPKDAEGNLIVPDKLLV